MDQKSLCPHCTKGICEDSNLEEYFEYLDELRESGETNMFGARPYLQKQFLLDKKEAGEILAEWMRTFGERHPKLPN